MSRKRKQQRLPDDRGRGQQGNRSRLSGGEPAATASSPWGPREWLLAVALVIAVFLAYQPAWQGGFIWDDDAHVTRPELRSCQGLWLIWSEPVVTLQYYPLLHTAFWIEHKLWGDATLGYHLVNLALHALSALLVAVILRRLAIPGAFLAAAIFALHPVQVESVAWITEQKNTLSAAFYLGAMLTYLRFDRTRKTSWYLAAAGLFSLGMLCKTVIATFPAAMLVIFWWQRGRLSWRRDALPLLPFFLLGAAGGLITTWWELEFNKCNGPEFMFTAAERLLIAGRAVWFHLWKLVWPAKLTFIYPRWPIDADAWPQYLFPLAAAALLIVLWMIRRRTRAPLAAALFFGGTLFPVLGFFNLYTFRYSLVANHYQYLASLGVITLASAGIALLLEKWRLWGRPVGIALCLTLLATLAGLSWRQSRMFADVKTLYRTTIEENPECWLAHYNLGVVLAGCGRTDEAIAEYQKAMQINPNDAKPYNNLGVIAYRRGQRNEAEAQLRKALEINPRYAQAHFNLGIALAGRGQTDEAIGHYEAALEIEPNHVEAHNSLGLALFSLGRFDQAIVHYRKSLKIKPNDVHVLYNLGSALAMRGQIGEAIVHFRQVVKIEPNNARAHNNLGVALEKCGLIDEAIEHFQEALKIEPDYPGARQNLSKVQSQQARLLKALAERRELLQSRPDDVALLSETAWALATNPNASIRNGTEAVELARRAVRVSNARQPAVLATLAAAYAETGQFADAVQTAEQALALASSENQVALADALRGQIKLYRARIPIPRDAAT